MFDTVCKLIFGHYLCTPKVLKTNAEVAQLVEHHLAKVRVAGSNLVFRSKQKFQTSVFGIFCLWSALVVELVDTQDLKSCLQQCECGFKSRLGHIEKAVSKETAFYFSRRLIISSISAISSSCAFII